MKRYLFLFTFLSLLLFWPIFLGKVNLNGNLLVSFYPPYGENLPFKNSGWDQLRIYFPFYRVTLDAIKSFSFPLWNPYAFSGHPHLADFQSAVFYPLNIFGFILPQIEFWHLLRITPMILAGFFTFLFLKNLKLSNLASFFGAMTFGFSPFILTWGEEVVMSPHSIVWLPLILWAIERFWSSQNDRKAKRRIYLAVIALATASSFLGGYMQTSIYMFIFVFGYLVFRLWGSQDFHLGGVSAFGRNSLGAKLFHLRGGISLYLIGSFALGVGLAAIQLLPSAELYFNSARSSIKLTETLYEFLLPGESLLTYLAPDFFGHPATYNFFRSGVAQYYEGIMFVGVATLIFALYAISALPLHPRGVPPEARLARGGKALRYNSGRAHPGGDNTLIMFLAIFGLISLSTTLDLPTSRLFLQLPLPFLSTSIANRILFIPAFCLAVLAALGMDRWLKKQEVGIKKIVYFLAASYLILILTLLAIKIFKLPYFEHLKFYSADNVTVSLRNLVIPVGVFVATAFLVLVAGAKFQWKRIAAFLILLISFLHIFYFAQKYWAFGDRKYIFPNNPILAYLKNNQGYFRIWGVGTEAAFGNNFASQYGLFWPEGYDSLNNRTYSEFTFAMQGYSLADFVFRSDAGLGALGKTEEILANSARRKLVDMVGVKYVVAKEKDTEILEKNNFKKVFVEVIGSSGNSLAVFENLQVLPRAFLASNYEGPPIVNDGGLSIKDEERERRKLIFQKLLDEDFDWRNVLVLEKPSPVSAQFGEGMAEIVSYKPQEVVIGTKSDQPKLLFLSDNYYPGWKATVDGDETEIWRANYTFRAVPLTSGEHEVRFYYDSWVVKAGLTVSVVSLGLLVSLLFIPRYKLT